MSGEGERHASVAKPWGHYQVLEQGDHYAVKRLTVSPGQALSLQTHRHRAEHWFVLSGTPLVQVGAEKRLLAPNETVAIRPGLEHRLSNGFSTPAVVLEVGYGENIDENDIERLQDRYGRAAMVGLRPLEPPVMVCEIGCNHMGRMDVALEMIKVAAQFCKVDVVKFQKRCNHELLSPHEYNAPHPNPAHAYGATYGAHREFLEFSVDQHRVLRDACAEWGVAYSTSVWDLTSATEIAALGLQLIKVPSAINTDLRVLDCLTRAFPGEIHVSLGMTLPSEEARLAELFDARGRLKDLVLYHCTSGYPVSDDELYLMEIERLRSQYGGKVKGIGFSGHHLGIAADIAALALGATYFERHFTLDRTWKGTDHSASLEPDGLRRLTRDLKGVRKALTRKTVEISPVEAVQRQKLKRFAELSL